MHILNSMYKEAKQLIGPEQTKSMSGSNNLYYIFDLNSNYLSMGYGSSQLAKEAYMKNVIAYRCITLKVDQAKLITYSLFRGDKEITTHPLLTLLNSPYPGLTKLEFHEAFFTNMEIYGEGFIWKRYPGSTESEAIVNNRTAQTIPPALLYPLRPDYMMVQEGKNFLPEYYQYSSASGQDATYRFDVSVLGKSNIVHSRKYNPLYNLRGLSSIIPGGYAIDNHNQASQWNYNLLKSGAKPAGILKAPADANLDNDQVESLRVLLEEKYGGSDNVGKPMLLEGGLEWQQISTNATDMDFLNLKKNAAHEIGAAFAVPIELLNTEMSKYDNLSAAQEQLWDEAVKPMIDKYIDSLNEALVPLYGNDLKLSYRIEDIAALVSKRAKKMDTLEKVSYLTINEKREQLEYDPIEGGDELLIRIAQTMGVIPLSAIDEQAQQLFVEDKMKQGMDYEKAKKLFEITYG